MMVGVNVDSSGPSELEDEVGRVSVMLVSMAELLGAGTMSVITGGISVKLDSDEELSEEDTPSLEAAELDGAGG